LRRSSFPKASQCGGNSSPTRTRDAFGHAQLGGVGPVVAQLVKDKLGYKYHWAVADSCSAPRGTSPRR